MEVVIPDIGVSGMLVLLVVVEEGAWPVGPPVGPVITVEFDIGYGAELSVLGVAALGLL